MKQEDFGTESIPISQELVEILACPVCEQRPGVKITADKQYLKCPNCSRKFPINNGIPVMLLEEAIIDPA